MSRKWCDVKCGQWHQLVGSHPVRLKQNAFQQPLNFHTEGRIEQTRMKQFLPRHQCRLGIWGVKVNSKQFVTNILEEFQKVSCKLTWCSWRFQTTSFQEPPITGTIRVPNHSLKIPNRDFESNKQLSFISLSKKALGPQWSLHVIRTEVYSF